MKNLNISILNKVATYRQRDGAIVCGNSDYQITFTFDTEWAGYENKIARFKWNGGHKDVKIEEDNTVKVPMITDATHVTVGVYVEDLSTTTPAVIPCEKSILCGASRAYIPTEDGIEMLERIGTLEANDRSQESRLEALESGAGGGGSSKLYKHNVYINSGYIGVYVDEARIYLSYVSTSATPITTLAALINSPAVAVQKAGSYTYYYLQYAFASYDYADEAGGQRDVKYIMLTDKKISIYYITAYTVPVATAVTQHEHGVDYKSVIITDTVTEV